GGSRELFPASRADKSSRPKPLLQRGTFLVAVVYRDVEIGGWEGRARGFRRSYRLENPAPVQRGGRTRNTALMRGPTGFTVFGMPCSCVSCEAWLITSRLPWASSTSNASRWSACA